MAILHRIREILREFENAGGFLVYDREQCDVYAMNMKATNGDYQWGYDACDLEPDGYVDVTEYLQFVPFSINDLGYDDTVFAKIKNYNKNLF